LDRSQELGQTPVGKLLWKYFVPAIIGVLANTLYNIVDRIYIGRGVGALALSGLSVTFPIMIIAMAFGMLVGMGSASLVSIRLGQQNKPEAEKILGNAFTLLVIISFGVTVLGLIFRDTILSMFGAGPDTLGYAKQYITIILWGNIFQGLGFGMNNMIRAEGHAKIAMYTMLIGAVANALLDPLFIFVFQMGVAGAAIATVISMAITSSWVLLHFTGGRSGLKLQTVNLRLDKKIVLGIFSIGMAPFAMQLAGSVINALFNIQLIKYGGDLAVGAMGIINSVAVMVVFCVIAVNMASQPIIGFNYGAQQYARVKKTLKLALIAGTGITVAGWLAVEIFPQAIIALFNTSDPRLAEIGVRGMRILLAAFPVVGFQVVGGNFFQAIGKARIAMFLNMLRQVIVLIPMVLILPPLLGIDGVWLSGPIADFIAASITALMILREVKKLNAKHATLNGTQIPAD
jgi:putative MATE family efflux protein